MILRCTIDGLLLDALFCPQTSALLVFDGDESFALEAVEALYYVVVSATRAELIRLESAGYRLLRLASDFEIAAAVSDEPPGQPRRPDGEEPRRSSFISLI